MYPVRQVTDLKDILNSSAELYGDRTAYLYKKKLGGDYLPISFQQVREDVEALGTALAGQGLSGLRIGVIGENRYEWVISYLAVANGLGVVVPLDRELPAHEIAALMERAELSALIYSSKVEQKITEALSQVEREVLLISMDSDRRQGETLSLSELMQIGRQRIKDGDRQYIDAAVDPERMSMLLFTSGTTGLAKGVMLCHRNIASNIYNMSRYVDLTVRQGQQIGLSMLPMHHTYEFTCTIMASFYQGATIAFCEGLKYIVKNMEEAKVTYMIAVPLVFENMHQKIWKQAEKSGKADKMRKAIRMIRTLSYIDKKIQKRTMRLFKEVHAALGGHVRLMVAGAAPINPNVINDFNAMGITMLQGYGMTECSPIIALNPDQCARASAAGLPLPGTEIRIFEPDENGIGEIICKSESVMLGYYKDPEETANVIRDGWLYTGDYGYFDKDGYVYITGRKKNVIVTKNGKNIFPEEVEYYLNQSPFIAEVVVGGEKEDETGESVVWASIYPDHETILEQKGVLGEEELKALLKAEIDRLNEQMPFYKRVKRFRIRETEFDKTTTRKIKRWS
ncbi:MAG: AMP-binding protein [Eubacteriales bacterium]|nr:AMP-binding protein [Eubacteriales bacterium]NLV70659.1 AMP-binding protein [Clostridiales bacterium]